MGLINWAEEEIELQIDGRKDEIRRNKEDRAITNVSISKEWGIDPLLDNEQILEVENLQEEVIGMAKRFNHLTVEYANLYRSERQKWEWDLKNTQQLEEKELSDLEAEKINETAPIIKKYDDRAKQLDDDFNKWVEEKRKEFADRLQERKIRFENEERECRKPFNERDYVKYQGMIKAQYDKACSMVYDRTIYSLDGYYKKDVLGKAYRGTSTIDSVSKAKKVLSKKSAKDAESYTDEIDRHLHDLFRTELSDYCRRLGGLAADANRACEILLEDYENNLEEKLKKLREEYEADCESIRREELEWEANEKTEKQNDVSRKKDQLHKEANNSKKGIEDRYEGHRKEVQDKYRKQRGRLEQSMRAGLNGVVQKYRDHMEANYPKTVFRKQYETMAEELKIDLLKRKELNVPKYNIAIGRVFMPFETGADINEEFAKEAAGFLKETYPLMIYDALQAPKLVFPYFISPDRGIKLLLSYSKVNKEDSKLSRIINTIGLRILMNIPAYLLQFCLVDGTGIGTFSSIVRVDPALDKTSSKRIKGILAGGEVRSKEVQIREAVSIIRTELSGMTRSLRQYNSEKKLDSKPYRVMMIQHFPDRIDRETIENLKALTGMEGQNGFSSIITIPERADSEAKEEIRQLISEVRVNMVELHPESHPILGTLFKLERRNDSLPNNRHSHDRSFLVIDGEKELINEGFLKKLAGLIDEECKQYSRKELLYEDIAPDRKDWFRKSAVAAEGVSVELGKYLGGQPFVLNINDAYVHTVISGATGSGKSNLLRAAVTGILQNYKPDEIQLYIGDYKLGVDYSALCDVDLPQLSMVSLANVPAFVKFMLDEIGNEVKRRAQDIKEGMKIDDYNKANPDKPLKRIIVIIDELYQLLQEAREEELAEEIVNKISAIAHQYRAFGVHLVLASQHMTKIGGIEDVIEMCHNRIIFDTEDDISCFLDSEANATAGDIFKSIGPEDKGSCVFTNDSGKTVDRCQVVNLVPEEQGRILKEIERECSSKPKYTRILLAQPKLCERHPFTEFCRQGKLPPVIKYYKEEKLLKESFFLWIGQTMESATRWGIEAPDGSLWILGGEGEAENAGKSVMFYALVSLVMEKCRRRIKGGDLTIMYCDALDESIGLETDEGHFIKDEALCGEYWDYQPGLGFNEDGTENGLPESIMMLSEEVEKRYREKSEKEASKESVSFEPMWMLINRMETNRYFTPRHMDAFRKAIRKGREVNVHVIVWTKTPERNDDVTLYEEARNLKVLQTLVLETNELREFRMDRQGLEASGYQAHLIAPAAKRLRIYDLLDHNRADVARRLSDKSFSISDEKSIFIQM